MATPPPPSRALPTVALVAVAILALNDHWFKHAYPGWLTGKLSDVAGMVFFPLLLRSLAPRRLEASLGSKRLLLGCCAATAIAFTLAKTTTVGNEAYRFAWGAMQWPFWCVRALVGGRRLPAIHHVALVKDATDLLALPFVAIAYFAGRRPARR